MADVKVTVELTPGWEEKIVKLPSVKGAVTKESKRLCESANSMASGFKSGRWYDPKTKSYIGETQAQYATNTKSYPKGPVGLVYSRNYAAKKDNLTNNTLAKVIAHG